MARLEAARRGPDYRVDFVAWADCQGRLLREGRFADLDLDNVIEEIEGLSGSVRSALSSQVQRVAEHLLKLLHSPAADPQRGWRETIRNARSELERVLDENPSLGREMENIVAKAIPRAARLVIGNLEDYGELTPAAAQALGDTRFTVDEIVSDWFPKG